MKKDLVNQQSNYFYHLVKRLLDIVLSLISIIFILPFLIPIIIMLRFTGEGEIFYLQNRVGLGLKNIKIFKFATMLKNSENMGSGIYTSKEDERVLPFGKFLRKTKINELPQLVNILIGDMTIVGPRPLIRETFELYDEEDQVKISSIRPGLTGIGSIVFRSEDEILAKSDIPLDQFYEKHITPFKAKLENWYLSNMSLITDIKIILLTVLIIIFPKKEFFSIFFNDLPEINFLD